MVNDIDIRGVSHTEENAIGSISKMDGLVKARDKSLKGIKKSHPPMQSRIIEPDKVNLKIIDLQYCDRIPFHNINH